MKVCSLCRENQPLDAFYRDPKLKFGVSGWCRTCNNAATRRNAQKVKLTPKPAIREKRCSVCHELKSATAFSTAVDKRDGLASSCKVCRLERERLPRMLKSPHQRLDTQLWADYRMRSADKIALMEAQGQKCAICRSDWSKATVDHDHETGAVRGLLCYRCNTQLRAVEDPGFVERAMAYLNHHRAIAEPAFRITPRAQRDRHRQKRFEATLRAT